MSKNKFHVNNAGEPGECNATIEPCPFGLSDDEHYKTREGARAAYEEKMAEHIFVVPYIDRDFEDPEWVSHQRDEFFNGENSSGRYILVGKNSGTVFLEDAVVMEWPEDEQDIEDFLNNSDEFLDEHDTPEFNIKSLTSVRNLSKYSNPIVAERGTGYVIEPSEIYAIDVNEYIVDIEEVLDSDNEASEAADAFGFPLWDDDDA